jgi:hypothetical protein
METLLVRLKQYDPRRGHVLRRYTYRGIKVHEERGWYRVNEDVAEHLRSVRQIPSDEHSPLAFDVCTEAEAKVLDANEKEAAATRTAATDSIKVSEARAAGALTTEDLPAESDGAKGPGRRGKRE